MCGRFLLFSSGDEIARHFDLAEEVPDGVPRYNVAPTQQVLCVGLSREGKPAPARLRWGLVPPWATEPRPAIINAKVETAADKPAFAEALSQRRCLIPADGYFEWAGTGKEKRPWHFRLQGGGLFAFAGLWGSWRPSSGPPLLGCALLTTAANSVVQPVHARMPVILPPDRYAAWLDRGLDDPAAVLALLAGPSPADALEASPVGTYVNDPKHEGPECIQAPAA
jgi:putative SOS response-associated peptidase YedK